MDKTQADRIRENVLRTRKGTQASRYGQKGLTSQAAKMNSKNFRKLMTGRNLSRTDTKNMWNSFSHSTKTPVMARHAKKGENFKVTSGKNGASGNFVSKKSLGRNPSQRVNKGALPPSNPATKQTNVKLAKNQNLVYGKIAPQKQFQKADPKGMPRKGGGMQTITNGGYKSGAIKNSRTLRAPSYRQKAAAMNQTKAAKMTAAKSTTRSAMARSAMAKSSGAKMQTGGGRKGFAGKSGGRSASGGGKSSSKGMSR